MKALKSRLAALRNRGDYPWLVDSLAVADARARWLKQRWDLRAYDPADWQSLRDEPQQLVNWVFDAHRGALAPLQSRAELTEFAQLAKSHSPRTVLEIGTARGGTFLVLCRMAAEDARIISIDLPAGLGGGGYPEWKIPILRSFGKSRQTIDLLRVDSHLDETLVKVKSILGDEQLDLLFIDADHSYVGALSDFERYSTLVRPGGLICMHDVVPNPHSDVIEVDRVWDEVSQGRNAITIRDPANVPGYGIGVLKV
ncbi:MAG: O-methyltransferase [Actinomycetota bacterium]